jgi:hypothetical protein
MELPQYVTLDEVRRICQALSIRDWTQISSPEVTIVEAETILKEVNKNGMDIPVEDFKVGLEVELEHGTRFDDANVTNNHPLLTGMIVLAHLHETMDYYQRLDIAEAEGDLLKAILAGDIKKIETKYRNIIKGQQRLNQTSLELFKD